MFVSDNEFEKIIPKIKFHFENIYSINNYKFQEACGSYLFNGLSYEYEPLFYEKQKLLYDVSKTRSNVLEIGVYMGHSILIMLLANPKINITCIDIDGTYAIPSINYLKKQFPNATINLIINDSINTIGKINKDFDFFHIDGDHKIRVIIEEIFFILNKRHYSNLRLLFDDVGCMLPIKDCILRVFECNYIEPKCKSPNIYFDIKIEKNKFEKQILIFKKEIKKIRKYIIFQDLKVFVIKILSKIYYIIFLSNNIGRKTRKVLKKNRLYRYITNKLYKVLDIYNSR